MPIADTNHKTRILVKFIRSRKFYLSGPGLTDYTYRQAALTTPDGRLAMLVTTKFQPGSLANWIQFAAYSIDPQYQGQEPIDLWSNPRELGLGYHPDQVDQELGPLYLYGKFVATDVWRDIYSFMKCKGYNDFEEVLQVSKATMRRLSLNKTLGCCLPWLCWRKILVECQSPDSARVVLARNQKHGSIAIREGHASLLEAVIMTFATDQMFFGCAPNCPCS